MSLIEAILLSTLKITGIILLIILILLLILICIVLFVPIIYKVNMDFDEKFNIDCKLKAVFGLITAYIDAENENKVVIKVCGIPIKKSNSKKKMDSEMEEHLKEEEAAFNSYIEKLNTQSVDDEQINQSIYKEDVGENLFSRIKVKIKSIVLKFKEVFQNIKNIANNILDKVSLVKTILSDELTPLAINESKGSVFKFLIHLLPKKADMVLVFGLEDPGQVGYILATISPFYGLYGKWLTIEPHFDEKVLKLNGTAKGRVYLFYLLWHFLKVYLNKNVKTLVTKYKISKA